MYSNLNNDVIQIIINNLSLKDLIKLRLTNKKNIEIVKYYNQYDMIPIKGSLKDWKKSFPNAKSADISKKYDIIDNDFQYLNNLDILIMYSFYKNLNDTIFYSLLNLKELHIVRSSYFTDKIFFNVFKI